MNRQLLLISAMFFFVTSALFAQPANDDCSGAIEVLFADDEESAVLTDGDSRGATFSPGLVCSNTWAADDTWYQFTAPDTIPLRGITAKAYFGENSTDVLAVGMGLYTSCSEDEAPIVCFSSADPTENELRVICDLIPGETYYLRIWSGGSATDNSGTFKVGVFATGEFPVDTTVNVIFKETFKVFLCNFIVRPLHKTIALFVMHENLVKSPESIAMLR